MELQYVDSMEDERLRLYRNVKDNELERNGDRFIVEGHFVVQRVLASDFPVESVMIAQRKLEEMRPFLREGLPTYVVPDSMTNQIVGFQFHTGVIAIARRKPPQSLDQFMQALPPRAMLMILPQTTSLQNMGGLIRVAAAFGVNGVLIGEESVDPFYRLPIRVSMGNVFRLPIIHCKHIAEDLDALRKNWGVELMATVLDDDAEPLQTVKRPDRVGLLFGSEGYGLDRKWLDACQRKITIPMSHGTDSLNVAVSAAVFLWEMGKA